MIAQTRQTNYYKKCKLIFRNLFIKTSGSTTKHPALIKNKKCIEKRANFSTS